MPSFGFLPCPPFVGAAEAAPIMPAAASPVAVIVEARSSERRDGAEPSDESAVPWGPCGPWEPWEPWASWRESREESRAVIVAAVRIGERAVPGKHSDGAAAGRHGLRAGKGP
ncbi:hypothetical protein GCM10009591_36010 [Brachybacterium tyrofermentans]